MAGGPAADPVGYIEAQFDYYMPNLDYKQLSDRAFVQKWKHLEYIRQQESKEALAQAKAIGGAAQLPWKRKNRR